MNKLEELRDYLHKEIGNLVTIIYDRQAEWYQNRDRIRIKRDGFGVCNIYNTNSNLYNVIFYDPFICRSAGYSSVVNLTFEDVPQAIKNRLSIHDVTSVHVDVNVSNDDVERSIYMMTARGNGKTKYVSDLLKDKSVVYNGNIYNDIKDVIFNDPATIVFWVDGSKTVVKCRDGETFDPEKGLAMAISKKVLGNNYGYYETFAKHVGRYNKKHKEK